jgi:hypothetical protein
VALPKFNFRLTRNDFAIKQSLTDLESRLKSIGSNSNNQDEKLST